MFPHLEPLAPCDPVFRAQRVGRNERRELRRMRLAAIRLSSAASKNPPRGEHFCTETLAIHRQQSLERKVEQQRVGAAQRA